MRVWIRHSLLVVTLLAPSKQSLCIAKIIYQQGLVDIWREINPTMQDYTHFSYPNISFAKINHIFISASHILYLWLPSPLVGILSGGTIPLSWSFNVPRARKAMDAGGSINPFLVIPLGSLKLKGLFVTIFANSLSLICGNKQIGVRIFVPE